MAPRAVDSWKRSTGRRIARHRCAKGLTQAAVALSLGVTQSLVSQWESGNVELSARDLRRLADMLGTSMDHLAGRLEIDRE